MQSSHASALDVNWYQIAALRRRLHRHPEVSEQEYQTAAAVVQELAAAGPDRLITGLSRMRTGVCAVYEGKAEGPTVMLRCELDALPIRETGERSHRSVRDGVAHLCGHDGHMATMIAVAQSLRRRGITRGKAVLLFQPAEETGTGAAALLDDRRFTALSPDVVLGFHNLPTFPCGVLVVRSGIFAAASVGFIVTFGGRTSHSSYPEHGLNPTAAVAGLMEFVNGIETHRQSAFGARSTGTITSARVGAVELGANFGTAPGEAVVMGVLRAYYNDDLLKLKSLIAEEAEGLAAPAGLSCEIEWREEFAVTENDAAVVDRIVEVARQRGWECRTVDEPFRWSEDFGRYLQHFDGAFFGIGSGEAQPQLHSDTYDYPDEIIPVGAEVYRALLDSYLAPLSS